MTDKNTWRGITLLSVGSKLLARVVASRIADWSEKFLHESQSGFRRGRGVEDCLIVSRNIVEEVVRQVGQDWIVMSFFDRKSTPHTILHRFRLRSTFVVTSAL